MPPMGTPDPTALQRTTTPVVKIPVGRYTFPTAQTTLRHRHTVRGRAVLLVGVPAGAARHRTALPAVARRDLALPVVALPVVALPVVALSDVALMSPVSG